MRAGLQHFKKGKGAVQLALLPVRRKNIKNAVTAGINLLTVFASSASCNARRGLSRFNAIVLGGIEQSDLTPSVRRDLLAVFF
jgi:hypothetical protein